MRKTTQGNARKSVKWQVLARLEAANSMLATDTSYSCPRAQIIRSCPTFASTDASFYLTHCLKRVCMYLLCSHSRCKHKSVVEAQNSKVRNPILMILCPKPVSYLRFNLSLASMIFQHISSMTFIKASIIHVTYSRPTVNESYHII